MNAMKRTKCSLLITMASCLLTSLHARAQGELLVAAAADLKFAMDSLVSVFSHEHPGIQVKVTYGSSGNFFEQISAGAPFDLFFSADIDYPRQLQDKGLTLSPVRQYGKGQIVLWSSKLDPTQRQMQTLLDPSVIKIAIANPAHAPYGKRAEESLRYYKLFGQVKDRLVLGENISQAAQFLTSGAADIGIIALSLARSPAMQRQGGHYWLIPEASHQPLLQGYVLLAHAKGNAAGESFRAFIGSAKARAVFNYFGL